MGDTGAPRVGFVSAVEIGAACIDEIHQSGGRLDLIMTLDDDTEKSKSGRVDLASAAELHRCKFLKVRNINDADALEAVRRFHLDWLFIIGWSQIAKPEVLSIPSSGVIGAHPTMLPVGRGRAPIPWAILKNLPETGVTFFKIDEGVDTGPIIAQQQIPLAPTEDAGTLYARVVETHRRLIRTVWSQITRGTLRAYPQNDADATYWPKRTPADGEILETMTVAEVDRLVRAVTCPYPGAFVHRNDSMIRIWAGSPETPPKGSSTMPIRVTDGIWWASDYESERPNRL